jgi:hypothetical protein
MKTISYWASRHILHTRLILIFIEILKACIAVNLGYIFFKAITPTLANIGAFVLCLILWFAEKQYDKQLSTTKHQVSSYYALRQRILALIYTAQIGLLMLIGVSVHNYKPLQEPANQPIMLSMIELNETATPSVLSEKLSEKKAEKSIKKSFRSKLYDRFMHKWQKHLAANEGTPNKTLFIILGILLIIAGIFFGLTLACGISCGTTTTNYVIFALLTVGCLGGGIWLLIKAFKKK